MSVRIRNQSMTRKGEFHMIKRPVLIATVVSVTACAAVAFAHTGATGVVKERMELMKSLSDANKELTAMVRGKIAYDAGKAAALASQIAAHAEKMKSQFPKGSNKHPSEAKNAIWENWPDFSAKADSLKSSAATLADAAKSATSGRAIARPFITMTRTCGDCHELYRESK